MQEILIAWLLNYIKKAAAEYITSLIQDLLSFDNVGNLVVIPQYPGKLLKTSEATITNNNLHGQYTITRSSHEYKRGSDPLEITFSDGRRTGQIFAIFPLFTSYVEWTTDENLSKLNIRQFRAYPKLYRLGSVYLESVFSNISNYPFLSEPVYLNKNELILKFSSNWFDDFRNSHLTENLSQGRVGDPFRLSWTDYVPNDLVQNNFFLSALWDLKETIHYSLQVPGKITTYGWPAVIAVFGQDDPNPPELPEGTLG